MTWGSRPRSARQTGHVIEVLLDKAGTEPPA
jgi:hypothetical protein